jgi:hypothetical protein
MSKQHQKAAVTRVKNAMMFFGDRKYASPFLMMKYLACKEQLKKSEKKLKNLTDGKQMTLDF